VTKRIAVSLPDELFRRMERVRKRRRVPRSRLVQEAVGEYVERTDEQALEAVYFEGYRRHPEIGPEYDALDRLAIEAARRVPYESDDA